MIDRSQHRRGEEGFSFVELLVVMLILGVLATLAIPSFFSVRDRGWHAAAKSDARSMTKYIATGAADGAARGTIADLVALGFDKTADVTHGMCTEPDELFVVAASHDSHDSVWIIDQQGRLTESGESDVAAALADICAPASLVDVE